MICTFISMFETALHWVFIADAEIALKRRALSDGRVIKMMCGCQPNSCRRFVQDLTTMNVS